MKKALLIALFGLMFVGLASFTNGTQPEATSENDTSISKPDGESKEYIAAKTLINKYNKLFKNATSCDEIKEIVNLMYDKEIPYFEEEDRMTEDEQAEIEKMAFNLVYTIQNKVIELGCDE